MDRAHRLGQTRTVNVYRLLMQGTLEEKVMGLQQFKLNMANSVVNQDNVSLSTMDTGKLLDLFGTTPAAGQAAAPGSAHAAGPAGAGGAPAERGAKSGLGAMLAGMGEMWDEREYSEQFDLRAFMAKLGRSRT